MLLYLSGKYTLGDIEENIQAARKVAIVLWEQGYSVLCPHQNTAHFENDCKATYEQYLRGDLLMVERCDAIVMLPGWEESRGANLELTHAKANNVTVFYWGIDELLPPTAMPELPELLEASL